jgi:pimeloyl-ACP methyl ester carboxylesterase
VKPAEGQPTHGSVRAGSLVLVHGAGSGPWIFDDWPASFPGLDVHAVDLHAGLDVGRASMADYAARLVSAAQSLPRPAALCGWSMGGLVVLQASARLQPDSVILIEASPPAEVQGFHPSAELADGTFDPQTAYGPFPTGIAARPESMLARTERKRGISVPHLPCPSLVIFGDEFPDARGTQIARLYGSDQHYFAGLDHWGLVRNRRAREAIARFLVVEREPGTPQDQRRRG